VHDRSGQRGGLHVGQAGHLAAEPLGSGQRAQLDASPEPRTPLSSPDGLAGILPPGADCGDERTLQRAQAAIAPADPGPLKVGRARASGTPSCQHTAAPSWRPRLPVPLPGSASCSLGAPDPGGPAETGPAVVAGGAREPEGPSGRTGEALPLSRNAQAHSAIVRMCARSLCAIIRSRRHADCFFSSLGMGPIHRFGRRRMGPVSFARAAAAYSSAQTSETGRPPVEIDAA
jgi:hypothetical protein